MMRLLLFIALSFFLTQTINGQSDTLLFEDFQDELDLATELDPDIIDQWHNLDLDQIPPDPSSGITTGGWYWSEDFENYRLDTIIGDTNFVYGSNSWLTGFDPNNRNWLISPAIPIIDENASLHFKCAPYQLPRYMDRISVMVSTGESYPIGWSPSAPDQLGDYDVIFRTAEMTAILGSGQTTHIDSFAYSEGYIHANMLTDSSYFIVNDSTLLWGTLEPHSVSLADFANKQIFIAFVHDSSDDYQIMVDDILVLGTEGTLGIKEGIEQEIRFVTFPNPVDNYMNVMFKLESSQKGGIRINDTQGRLIKSMPIEQFIQGENQYKLDLRSLSAGTYILSLNIGEDLVTKRFIKR